MSAGGSIGVLYSGGLDSAILLAELAKRCVSVQPLYVRFGLFWEEAEERHGRRFVAAAGLKNVAEPVTFDLPLADVYGPHWSVTGRDVPGSDTPDEAVFLPGRNVLLLAKPALWSSLHDIGRLALGPLGSNPFPDSTPEFYRDYQAALNRALDGNLEILRPFETLTKVEVMQLGRALPLERTFSCIRPVEKLHCGRCNKCAERQRAFRNSGIEDETTYAATAQPSPSDPGP